MFKRLKERIRDTKLSMRTKLTLSLSAIAVALLASSVISILEYSRMSHYVSDLMADNIKSVGVAQKLSEVSSQYNLGILAVIGDDAVSALPDFHQEEFMAHCDSLRQSLVSDKMLPLTDSVVYAYSAYMLTSMELSDVLLSDFIDTRTWYFERLQPQFKRLNAYIDNLDDAIYAELKKNSETFQRGFYRSIIPGAVAVGVGLLLILMLLFYKDGFKRVGENVVLQKKALDVAHSCRDSLKGFLEGKDVEPDVNTSINGGVIRLEIYYNAAASVAYAQLFDFSNYSYEPATGIIEVRGRKADKIIGKL